MRTRSDAPSDLTGSLDYKNLVEEEIEHYSHIEVTEGLREGSVHAHEAWGYWYEYLQKHVWHTSFEDEIVRYCDGVEQPRILSLGCGYGGIELEIARRLRKPFEMIALDLNDGILKEARKRAGEEGLNIRFEAADLNFVDVKEGSFDLVYAHASLHHILNLEHLFWEIYKGLKPDGRFIALDVIGKTQVLFWQENVEFAAQVVREMPQKYKGTITDPYEIIPRYVEPGVQFGMEGVRQEEIEGEILKYFVPVQLFKYCSFMRMICTNPIVGKALNPQSAEDRAYLDELAVLDVKQVEEKKLRPTEMFGTFAKRKDAVFIPPSRPQPSRLANWLSRKQLEARKLLGKLRSHARTLLSRWKPPKSGGE
ncbi:MAG: class I SAM-dependent methyltransferase [Verrucomicrobiota bacterium]|nr:class I SAM-dependent methyltransferase [Verrucomicrobiota bacterium]